MRLERLFKSTSIRVLGGKRINLSITFYPVVNRRYTWGDVEKLPKIKKKEYPFDKCGFNTP